MLYVPSMLGNLLSVGQFVQKGYLVRTDDNALELFDENQSLMLKSPLKKIKHPREQWIWGVSMQKWTLMLVGYDIFGLTICIYEVFFN